ncbi:MAG TPA: AI-2E family transporter [Burkholderiales bacterium]|nr:AI-2E family transporter [Burkholderiales bacterium]
MPEAALARRAELASCGLAAAALYLVLRLELLPALLAGLLVYELVQVMSPPLERRLRGQRSRVIALGALIALVIALLSALIVGGTALFKSSGGVPTLLRKVADVLEASVTAMPAWLAQWVPSNVGELREAIARWLREHSRELREFTGGAARALAHIIIGMAVGAMLSLRHARAGRRGGPLAEALLARAERFGDSFRRVLFAQARISAINTAATAAYLYVLLPLFGVELPLKSALVAVTFVAGLLPVIGNLISNSLIVVVSLAASLYAALGSIVFLAVIHKLEYFLNARIIGSRVNAHSWELLASMLVLQAAFGLSGLIAAPFYYAYVKGELAERGLV